MMTRLERDADNFDCDLYRLICRAERHAEESTPVMRAKWTAALWALRSARPHVREMMERKEKLQ